MSTRIRLVAFVTAATVLTAGASLAASADAPRTRMLESTSGAAAHRPLRVHEPKARASAKKKQPGLSKAQVLALVKQQIRKSGTTGPAGPTGPAGAQGSTGPAGSVTGIPIQKISFKSNVGSTVQVPYDGPGMKIEAECAATFQLRFRAEEPKGIVHAFAVGEGGVTYSAGFETETNNALDLVPAGEGLVSGKLEFTQNNTATNVTVNYMAAYGSSQGDCVFTGTIVQA